MKVISQMGPRVDAQLATAVPGSNVVSVPVDTPDLAPDDADVLLTFRRSPSLTALAQRVPWIHIAGAGVEGLDPLVYEGRVVTCSAGAHAIPIAEHVLAQMLAFEHRLPGSWVSAPPPGEWLGLDELERRLDSGTMQPPDDIDAPPERWGWTWLGELADRTLGIVGLGGIGLAVASRALAFDMRVVAVRRSDAPSPLPGVEVLGSLDELLARSDHLVLAAPGGPATNNLLDERTLSLLKSGAHIVNVARGSLVDEAALIAALDSGHVALASIDVGASEPLPAGHPFYAHPRVRLTPHISWVSPRRHSRVIDMFIDNLRRSAAGEPLHGVVAHAPVSTGGVGA